ncbi:hypothetical protein BKA69DRAFT_1093086 [Paraphysoderma sedebokerense]|nr:hypothetical protein BKA69DRAFT_1093086 [Paraphysoderma sedebokerense]
MTSSTDASSVSATESMTRSEVSSTTDAVTSTSSATSSEVSIATETLTSTAQSATESATRSVVSSTKTTVSTTPSQTAVPDLGNDLKKVLEVKADGNGQGVTVQARSVNQTIKFRTEFGLGVGDVPRLGARFYVRDNETSASFNFRVALLKIAEVNEKKNWTVLNTPNALLFPNTSSLWSPVNFTDIPNDSNVTLKKLSTTFSQAVNGSAKNVTVAIDAFLASEKLTLDGFTYLPQALKYGLTIENFPFVHNDSKLVIVKGVVMKSIFDASFSSVNRTIGLGNERARFAWTDVVSCDDVDKSITVEPNFADVSADLPKLSVGGNDGQVGTDESLKIVLFKTETGNFTKLVWDPELMLNEDKLLVNSAQNSTNNQKSAANNVAASLGVSLLAVAAAFLVTFV